MSWTIEIKLKNNLDKEFAIKIPKGQIFENKKIGTGLQNVASAHDYIFRIPAKSTLTVDIEVLCINQHLSPPSGSYNVTLFKIDNNFTNQYDLWALMKP
jgi:hypothetical protein